MKTKSKFVTVTAVILSLIISACSHNPHRTIEKYDSNAVIVKIMNHDEALRQLDLPACHFEGC